MDGSHHGSQQMMHNNKLYASGSSSMNSSSSINVMSTGGSFPMQAQQGGVFPPPSLNSRSSVISHSGTSPPSGGVMPLNQQSSTSLLMNAGTTSGLPLGVNPPPLRFPPLPLPQFLFSGGLQLPHLQVPSGAPTMLQYAPSLSTQMLGGAAGGRGGVGGGAFPTPLQLPRPPNFVLASNDEAGKPHTDEQSGEQKASDWTEHTAKNGRKYYSNAKLSISQWDKPDELKTPEELRLSNQTPWKEYTVADGRTYWHNKETKQSTWEFPEEVLKLREKLQAEKPQEAQWPKFETKAEARGHLKILFEAKNFPPKTTWESASKQLEADKRWASLSALSRGEKKQAFAEYMSQAQKRAHEEERRKRQMARECIVESLGKWEDISIDTTFSDFAEAFHESEWWNWIEIRESDDLFQDFMDDFEQRHREKKRKLRKTLMEKLREKFEKMPGNPLLCTWSSIKEAFRENSDFAELDLVDALSTWEDYIESCEKAEKEQMLKLQYRSERKRRDKFMELLEEAYRDGSLTATVEWEVFSLRIAEDDRFLRLIGQPGSTPLELFEEKKLQILEKCANDKSAVKKMIRKMGIEIDETSTAAGIAEMIKDEAELADVSPRNLTDALEYYIEKLKEKLMESRKKFARRQRKYFEFFDKYLPHYRKEEAATAVDANLLIRLLKSEDRWDSFCATFEGESTRNELFKMYLSQLNWSNGCEPQATSSGGTARIHSSRGRKVPADDGFPHAEDDEIDIVEDHALPPETISSRSYPYHSRNTSSRHDGYRSGGGYMPLSEEGSDVSEPESGKKYSLHRKSSGRRRSRSVSNISRGGNHGSRYADHEESDGEGRVREKASYHAKKRRKERHRGYSGSDSDTWVRG